MLAVHDVDAVSQITAGNLYSHGTGIVILDAWFEPEG